MSHALLFPRSAIAAACSLLIANAALAQAATDNAADAPLETVQVSGNWLGSGQKSVQAFGGARTVVKHEDIQDSGASSISDVLRTVPGDRRIPVRSAPISLATAFATSMAKRARFSMLPP